MPGGWRHPCSALEYFRGSTPKVQKGRESLGSLCRLSLLLVRIMHPLKTHRSITVLLLSVYSYVFHWLIMVDLCYLITQSCRRLPHGRCQAPAIQMAPPVVRSCVCQATRHTLHVCMCTCVVNAV